MKSRYTKGDKVQAILDSIGEEEYKQLVSVLRDNNLFIWSKGDLETYYSKKSKDLTGSKDIKALEISYLLQDENNKLNTLFEFTDEIEELVKNILKKNNSTQ